MLRLLEYTNRHVGQCFATSLASSVRHAIRCLLQTSHRRESGKRLIVLVGMSCRLLLQLLLLDMLASCSELLGSEQTFVCMYRLPS